MFKLDPACKAYQPEVTLFGLNNIQFQFHMYIKILYLAIKNN